MITRIQKLKEHLGLSTRAFAIKCGLNQPTLDRMLKGINALNLNCITSILSAFPEVSAEWLLRGEGEMFITSQPTLATDSVLEFAVKNMETLQKAMEAQTDTIAALQTRIAQLENQLK